MKSANFAKRDPRYWATRVFRQDRRDGTVDPEYSVRFMLGGKRRQLSLDTGNKTEAASRAARAYALAVDEGWDSAAATVNPHKVVRGPKLPTVGDLISEASSRVSHLRASSLVRYCTALRQVAADVTNIPRPASRFDYTKPETGKPSGSELWRAQVDAVTLDAFTIEALAAWKKTFVERAAGNAIREGSFRTTANATLDACARFWSKEMLPHMADAGLIMPPNPFAPSSVPRFKQDTKRTRYKSRVNAEVLLRLAKKELASEPWKAVALALFLGLRKGELDRLRWSHVDLDSRTLEIETTEDGGLKTGSSARTMDIPTPLAGEMQTWQDAATSHYVIEASGRTARPGTGSLYYRAEPAFDAATAWLRTQGIDGHHPIHTLRKEFGSLINRTFGLAAAAEALGHASVKVTAGYYVSSKERIEVGIKLEETQ
jgi:integrase